MGNIIYYVENKPADLSYELLDKLVLFAYEYLSIDESVGLELNFDSDIEKDVYGYCDVDEGEIQVEIKAGLSVMDFMTTFFHEMVHARQILSGQLVVGEGRKPSRWNGKPHKGSYFDKPWEIEAFELERTMVLRYLLTSDETCLYCEL